MYRHLLVPIDDTDLSIETIGRAVEFARALGARVSFLHVQPDYAASMFGEAEAVRLTSPAEYLHTYVGRARELLTKAESAARAQGVPCASLSRVGDTPYTAIVEAARENNCDLIFIASHGRKTRLGMMLGSQTLKVLTHANLPVLVSATSDPSDSSQTIGIIRDEHRSLAAVLHAWQHLIATAAQRDEAEDIALMRGMCRYLAEFPVALHHPKEDDYLFRLLRARTSVVNAELDELERQHERDEVMVESLSALVEKYARGQARLEDVHEAVEQYAKFIWEHLGREEGVILPAAQRYLTEADWIEVHAAFEGNQDPRFAGDTDAEFKRLFSRIVNLASPRQE
jgi:nucleotide-binding universal stress UspA family protein/hemerythrin-like domain-containing protein